MIETLADTSLEQLVLSSCVESENFYEVSETIKAEHFFKEEHQIIWNVLKRIDDRGSVRNSEMVAIELTKEKGEYLGSFKLLLAKQAMPNLKVLAVELIEWYNKRELYKLSLLIQESLNEKAKSSYITQKIDETTIGLDVSIGSRAKNYKEWEEHYNAMPSLPIFPTGISFIDDALGGGVEAGQLIIVMGDPEAGKTIMTTQILRNVSNGFPTLFFCFEFTVRQFIQQNIKRKKEFNKENMLIVNDGYSLSDVEREIKIWAKRGVRFVCIDSQMRVDNSENKGTVEQMESEKFNKLAKLCHKLEIIILFIAQQGKEDSKGGVHTPMGSKKGAHEANQIWFIYKKKPKYDEAGNDENKESREIEISKNKQNGRHFRTEVKLNPVVLEFFRKYNKEEPKETIFTDGKDGKKIPVEIIKQKTLNTQEQITIDVPQIL